MMLTAIKERRVVVPDTYLTPVQTGQQLGLTTGALAQMRYLGTGPKFLKFSARAVRYRQHDIDEWVRATERRRTDDRPGVA